jgi:FAD/FMN-containing dehydrogenase
MEACVALGGTISGEHGVGSEKIEAMRMVFSEDDLEFQRGIQRAFDPNDTLNPEKIVPPLQNEIRRAPSRGKLDDRRALVPADEDEACEMVQAACAEGLALLPVGGGRRADFGNAPERASIPLCSEELAALVEHDPANQVVAAGAGMKLAALQERLATENQWLPVRPPLADGCTLGGLAALAACGPERLRYGAPRDLLLGLRFVSGKGRPITGGGRVVKNVAGYDVTRLMTGSAGTLGFLTELTFRVLAVPECCRAVVAHGSLEACAEAAVGIVGSVLEPVFATAVQKGKGSGTWELTIGFEGFAVRVSSQVERGAVMLRESELRIESDRRYDAREGMHAGLFERLFSAPFVLRADLPPDWLTSFMAEVSDTLRDGDLLVDFGCGRVLAGLPDLAEDSWAHLHDRAATAQGHVLLERAPDAFKRRHDIFGPPRPEWKPMHGLKDALDPLGTFAPGRLPGRK